MKKNNWLTLLSMGFRQVYGNDSLSDQFIELMNKKLSNDFKAKTGIDITKSKGKICVSPVHLNYSKSKNAIHAGITVHHYGTNAIIKWKSNSGKIITPADRELNENDIEIWFDYLETKQILIDYARMHKKPDINLNQYNYEIIFDSFFWESLYFLITLWEGGAHRAEEVIKVLDDFVIFWNQDSENNEKIVGVIHNSGCKKITDSGLEYYFDMGSASLDSLRQLFEKLNELRLIKKIVVTSYP